MRLGSSWFWFSITNLPNYQITKLPDGSGAVAQLGERLVCNQEVTGSIPVSSTKTKYLVISTWYLAKPDARIFHDLLVLSSQHLAMTTKLNTNY